MYHRSNLMGWYCVVCHVFPWLHHFLILSTLWKKMRISEKEGDFTIFDTDILNSLFLSPIANITAQPRGKIGMHTLAVEELIGRELNHPTNTLT